MGLYFIVINEKESKKQNCLIVETVLGNGKILKNGQYSGPQVNCKFFDIPEQVPNQILVELEKSGNCMLKDYRFSIAEENLISFFENCIGLMKIFYHNKKKMDPINELRLDSENIKKAEFELQFQKYLLKFYKNQVFVTEHEEIFVVVNEVANDREVVNGVPIGEIDLILDGEKLIAELGFSYDNKRVKEGDSTECIEFVDYRLRRNRFAEKDWKDVLLQSDCWKKYRKNEYIFCGEDIQQEVERLLEKEFIILALDNKKVVSSRSLAIEVSYNIDWFELKMEDGYTQRMIHNLSEQFYSEEFSFKSKTYILVDNKIQFLPKAFIEKEGQLCIEEGKIGFPKNQLGNVLEMQAEMQQFHLHNVEQLTSYQDIEIDEDNPLKDFLYPHQVEGVKWLLYLYSNGFGGCLADDMGLGKTIQAIAMLSDKKVRNVKEPSLIILPNILICNWLNEFKKYSVYCNIGVFYGMGRKLDSTSDIIITTYDTAYRSIDLLCTIKYNVIIMDEFQKIKNGKSKRYNHIDRLVARCKIALTGTPVENNVMELWALMNMLNPGIMGSAKKFREKYLIHDELDVLKKKIEPFLLRREKNILKDVLPKKREQIILCNFDEKQKILYQKCLEYIRLELLRAPDRFEIKDNSVELEGLIRLRQICDHPYLIPYSYNINKCGESKKVDKILEIIDTEYEKNGKIVVFSQFVKMLDVLKMKLMKKNFPVYYVTGETPKREEELEKFQNSKKGILLLSLKSSGFGINLTTANVAILCEPWWNPAVERQAEDRIYRIGQKRKVTIYRMIMKDSIEEKIQELQEKKRGIESQLMNGQQYIKDIQTQILNELCGKR